MLGLERRVCWQALSSWLAGHDNARCSRIWQRATRQRQSRATLIPDHHRNRADLDVRWRLCSESANVSGRVCRTILLDVSTQREAERALSANVTLPRAGSDGTGHVCTRYRGRIPYQPLMEELSGYRQDEVVGKIGSARFCQRPRRSAFACWFRTALRGDADHWNMNPILTRMGASA